MGGGDEDLLGLALDLRVGLDLVPKAERVTGVLHAVPLRDAHAGRPRRRARRELDALRNPRTSGSGEERVRFDKKKKKKKVECAGERGTPRLHKHNGRVLAGIKSPAPKVL